MEKNIEDNLRISNSYDKFLELFGNKHFVQAVGNIEFESFKNSHFIYSVGEDENLTIENHLDKINSLLIRIQSFIS